MRFGDREREIAICSAGASEDVRFNQVGVSVVQVERSGDRVVDDVPSDSHADDALVEVDPPRVHVVASDVGDPVRLDQSAMRRTKHVDRPQITQAPITNVMDVVGVNALRRGTEAGHLGGTAHRHAGARRREREG